MRAQRELRKIQKESEAFEKETKKTTDNFRRLTAFLAPKATTTRSTNSNRSNTNRNSNTNNNRNTNSNNSNNTKINITLKNLERSIENNNKKSSNENDAILEMIYNRRVNSNMNTETFDMVDEMLNITMHNHRAGVISNKQMQKNLAAYLNHIEHRYRHSNRGLTLERKIRWYMGSKGQKKKKMPRMI